MAFHHYIYPSLGLFEGILVVAYVWGGIYMWMMVYMCCLIHKVNIIVRMSYKKRKRKTLPEQQRWALDERFSTQLTR